MQMRSRGWFPAGEEVEHGARAEEDVVVLFMTNKPFEIQYEGVWFGDV